MQVPTRLRAGGEGAAEDEMVGWHHRLKGHEFEQTLGDGEGQGSLACCSPRSRKESDMTEHLNNSNEKGLTSLRKMADSSSGTGTVQNEMIYLVSENKGAIKDHLCPVRRTCEPN